MIKPLGLWNSQIEFIENVLRTFLNKKKKMTVSIFGSRVRGGYLQYSDLDLWIEATPPLTRTEEADLRGLFEDSDLAIKVDIVTPESCLESYLENITAEKKSGSNSAFYHLWVLPDLFKIHEFELVTGC